MNKKLLFLLIIINLYSCNKIIEPESPKKIFDKYKSSVVLIAHQYYYEIESGADIYFFSPSSVDKIFMSRDEALRNLTLSTGTGFLISKEGEIITNKHVVNPKCEEYEIELKNYMQNNIAFISNRVEKLNDSIISLKNYYNENFDYLDYSERENLKNRFNNLVETKKYSLNSIQFLNQLDFSKCKVKLITENLCIAFNDTHVTKYSDMQECVTIKLSNDDNIDLALIQTKDKKFNSQPKYLFNFNDNNPNFINNPEKIEARNLKNPVKINDDVYMIGFNRGFSLANTKQGIKSQFTSGKISQENDGERILYTIPTLEGSSGSPIVDKWGNLVGVNFAKITNSQSFSFGVPVNEVKKFYEE